MPKVSVVIPCYNLGKYIDDAIKSVLEQTYQNFEIIIVDDGSTETETKLTLDGINDARITVLKTVNQGLPSARNTGIAHSTGEYILPLDADDKIAPTYLQKAVEILNQNVDVGIVYCQAEFFGIIEGKWDLPDFEINRMLLDNLIFCSAFFRRTDWERVGGYNPEMIYGWEDYDFWLSIIGEGKKVLRIPEVLFFYRQRAESMASSLSRSQMFYSYQKIAENHKQLYIDNISYLFEYIYLLRDNLADSLSREVEKDTRIHNLNLEIGRTERIIGNLEKANSELNEKLSNGKAIFKLLIKSLSRKLRLKFKNIFRFEN